MSIPQSQLETWSHQGSVTQSKTTYAIVKNALEANGSAYADKSYKVFLQGSYANDTNVYAESDVDVVVELESVFYYDLEGLPQDQQDAFSAAHPPAAYGYEEFKKDVVAQLQGKFGAAIDPDGKAVKIKADANRRSADVLVATQFHRYHRYFSSNDQSRVMGICFFNAAGMRIENYPRQHSENCTFKHQATKSWLKPMVRIFRNLRGRLVNEKIIPSDLAPSYYIEGLLYNVPNDKFGGSYENSLINCINWILGANRSKFVCANEQYYLLRDDPNVTWSPARCDQFLNAAIDLWNKW
jgi:Nucleotidyltransferase domain